jgi:guanylate kinase
MSTVFIVSAPSGSGKSTLVKGLLERDKRLVFSVSYTTRAPRGAEREGESYHYIGRAEFEDCIRRDEFLEFAEVFGNFYGTHRRVWEQARQQDRDLLLDIDVQGARQLKERIPDAVSVFILAPSRQELEQRLRARSEDSEAVIQRRLREAAEEIRNYTLYDYVVVNHRVEESVRTLEAIIQAERVKRQRMERQIAPILASFEKQPAQATPANKEV